MTPTLAAALAEDAARVEAALDGLLAPPPGPERRVFEAMRYACLGGGKRLRPFLVLESCRLSGVAPDCALRIAAALEMVHCYSLVHDDLPAMDDDDMRRGRPTAHKAFDEATAILAGDGLLTRAFETLADPSTHPDGGVRAALVLHLARAAGPDGMVGGQTIDMAASSGPAGVEDIARLQSLKTGALFRFACESGPIAAHAPGARRAALVDFARDFGLAFQMVDDILDVEGSADALGKAVGKDAARGTATFVSRLGLARAREEADRLAARAAAHLAPFGAAGASLRDLAAWVARRRA
jgi:farnesyl diphosphate synthase